MNSSIGLTSSSTTAMEPPITIAVLNQTNRLCLREALDKDLAISRISQIQLRRSCLERTSGDFLEYFVIYLKLLFADRAARFRYVTRYQMRNRSDWDSQDGALLNGLVNLTEPHLLLSANRLKLFGPDGFVDFGFRVQRIIIYRQNLLVPNHELKPDKVMIPSIVIPLLICSNLSKLFRYIAVKLLQRADNDNHGSDEDNPVGKRDGQNDEKDKRGKIIVPFSPSAHHRGRRVSMSIDPWLVGTFLLLRAWRGRVVQFFNDPSYYENMQKIRNEHHFIQLLSTRSIRILSSSPVFMNELLNETILTERPNSPYASMVRASQKNPPRHAFLRDALRLTFNQSLNYVFAVQSGELNEIRTLRAHFYVLRLDSMPTSELVALTNLPPEQKPIVTADLQTVLRQDYERLIARWQKIRYISTTNDPWTTNNNRSRSSAGGEISQSFAELQGPFFIMFASLGACGAILLGELLLHAQIWWLIQLIPHVALNYL